MKNLSSLRTFLIVTAFSFGSIASTSSALAGPGDLDPDFGIDGKVTTDFTGVDGEDEGTDVVEVEDGKYVVVGWVDNSATGGTVDFALARYHEDGTLDLSFGTGGLVVTDFSSDGVLTNDVANEAVVDDEGRIIVVGSNETLPRCEPVDGELVECPANEFKFALARYDEDGMLDPSFGTGGLVTTSFPGRHFADAEAVALMEYEDEDGDDYYKIVAAGAVGDTVIVLDDSQIIKQPDWALVRYNYDGSLDEDFGDDGRVTSDFSSYADFGADRCGEPPDTFECVNVSFEEAASVAIEDDGIIVGGFFQECGDEPLTCPIGLVDADEVPVEKFAVARYDHSGSLDPSFGDGGLAITDFGDTAVIESIALQENDDDDGYRIVAAGLAATDFEEDFAVVRYNQDGTVDLGFGDEGKVTVDFLESFDEATDVAIMEDEDQYKIVVVGVSGELISEDPEIEEEDIGIVRLNDDGSLDSTFGDSGRVRTDIKDGVFSDEAAAGVVIEDDRIVVAGASVELAVGGDIGDFAIAVYDGEIVELDDDDDDDDDDD